MSEKKEAGLNEVDMQAVVAAWIVANDGCFEHNGWVSCSGEGGFFDSTPCPLVSQLQTENMSAPVCDPNKRVVAAKDWLEKYHQQKAEAAETERRKAEAAKKEEQETKQEPARICGNCKHIHEVEKSENMTAQCDMKKNMVPILFDRCPDFEPRAAADQFGSPPSEGGVDAAAYAECISQLERENTRLVGMIAGCNGVYDEYRTEARRERNVMQFRLDEAQEKVSQLEKDNARLAFSVHCHEEKMKLAVELCESGECDAKKDRANLAARCERLTEQRNRLSNSLIEMTRRVKEVERENDILAKKLVDFTAKWNDLSDVCIEKDGLIDRLRNANSRSIGEMYRAEAELKDERHRRKEVEKENTELRLRSRYEQIQKDCFQSKGRELLARDLFHACKGAIYALELLAEIKLRHIK